MVVRAAIPADVVRGAYFLRIGCRRRAFDRARRTFAAVAVTALVVTGLTVPTHTAAAAPGDPAIALSKRGPGVVLAGTPVAFTLTASNSSAVPGAVQEYNATFRDVLPPGVSYQAGSTNAAGVGDPQIFTAAVHFPGPADPLVNQQTLIWSNVGDLPVDGTLALGYQVDADPALYPMGATFTNSATDYASTAARLVPRFDAQGVPSSTAAEIVTGPTVSTPTVISAISIDKTDDSSPEGKLLRGVHNNVTVYTLTVTNNGYNPTSGVTVVDYLPADEEFLGCGTDEFSAAVEYAGAPQLGAARTVTTGCSIPAGAAATAVQTVSNPTPTLTGIFTTVSWTLPDLPANQVFTIRYAAGIPLRDNTILFPGGTPGTMGPQGSNLDNNTGAGTRQVGNGSPVTNSATVSGIYHGATSTQSDPAIGTPVSGSDTYTVTAKDVRVRKSVLTPSGNGGKSDPFTIGDIAQYTVQIDTSEYVSAQQVALTDTLDDGLCPLVSQAQWDTLVADADGALDNVQGCVSATAGPAVVGGGALPYSSVSFAASTGRFTVTFSPLASIDPQSTVRVTYSVRMLQTFPGGPPVGTDTSSGDSFDNTASLTAQTTPITGTGETGPRTVTDSSSAHLTTSGPTLTKLIKPLPGTPATDYSCDGPESDYLNATALAALPAARTTFAVGDRVCFELQVKFAGGTPTRNAFITDFLPDGIDYLGTSAGPGNDVPLVPPVVDGGTLTWTPGTVVGDARLVPADSSFVVRLAGRINAPADDGIVDITGNLLKVRQQNSVGDVISLREGINLHIAPAIPLGLTKGVLRVNGVPGAGFAADTDHRQIRQGDVVDFRVDITHQGSTLLANDRPVANITVWDVLPAPFTCADVTDNPEYFGQLCADPADLPPSWHPTVTGRSILRWSIPGPVTAGATASLVYTITVPQIGPAVDASNTAYVSSYTADADDGPNGTTYHPADNIDGDVPPAAQQAPATADSSDVFTAPAASYKTMRKPSYPAGDGPGQAAVGEVMTYTMSARIPAGLTLNGGSLSEVQPLPSGLELLNAAYPPTAGLAPDAADPATVTALPAGISQDPLTGALSFAGYTNATATDQLLQISLTGRFTGSVGTQAAGARVTNVARLSYLPAGSATPTNLDASTTVAVVEPKPTLTKAVAPAGPYAADQAVTYTLTAGNTTGRPTAFDTWVVDCIPAGLALGTVGVPSQGTAAGGTQGAGDAGCPDGTTSVSWHVGNIPGGAAQTLSYSAIIDPAAAGGATYANTATLSAVSIPGAPRATPDAAAPDGARTYTATASRTVQVAVPALTKTADRVNGNIGDTVTYTVNTVVPAGVNLYSAVLRDVLPTGLDPNSLNPVSIDCSPACPLPDGALTPTSVVPYSTASPAISGNLATWSLGDLTAAVTPRTVTLVYRLTIADVAGVAVRGGVLQNGAAIEWNAAAGGEPPPFRSADVPSSGKVGITVLEPKIHLAKTVSNTTPEPGQAYSYTLAATNGGQAGDTSVGRAYSIVVTDAVPAGVVIGTPLPGGVSLTGTVNGSGGTLTWNIPGPLAPGARATITYGARLAASGTLTTAGQRNVAAVRNVYSQPSAGGRNTSTGGESRTATVTPDFPRIVPAKVALTQGPAYAGDAFTWRITLANVGTGRGYGMSATDLLPLHWAYAAGTAAVTVGTGPPVAIEPTSTDATGSTGQTLAWTGLAPLTGSPSSSGLAPQQSIVITFDAVPDASAPTSAGSAAPNINNVTATAADATGATRNRTTDYVPDAASAPAYLDAADVQLTKSAGAFVAGGSGSWALTVTNAGTDPAVGVVLTDTVPPNLDLPGSPAGTGDGAPLTITAVDGGPTWSCRFTAATGAVRCTRTASDPLAANQSFPAVTVTVDLPDAAVAGSTGTNAGSVTERTFDPNTGNNTASATGTVVTEGDLRIVKTLNDGTLTAGQDATYTVQVSNLGPSVSLADATHPITVTDPLPAGTTFVSAAGTGWACTPPTGGNPLVCNWTTTIGAPSAVNTAQPLLVTVAVASSRSAAVSNTATVTPGPTPDHDSSGGSNTSTVTATPLRSTDLGITKLLLDKGTAPVAGTDRQYEVTATDYGPSDAAGVAIHDTLPTGLSYLSASSVSGSWNCAAAGQVVTCSLDGALAGPIGGVAHSAVVHLSVHLAADHVPGTDIHNPVTVTSTTPDAGPHSNAASDDSTSTAQADLSLIKTVRTDPVVAGSPLSYRLQVHNAGPSVTQGLTTVTDSLPAGLSFTGTLPAGTGWTCAFADDGRSVSCDHAGVIPVDVSQIGAAGPIDVPVLADTGTLGPVTNVAAVQGALFDPDTSNNAASVVTAVTERAEVSVRKTVAADHVVAGTDATYGLDVRNIGPSTARGLTVVDTPDPTLVVTALSGPGWSCVLGTLTCTRDTLAVSAQPSVITVTAHPLPSVAAGTTLTNVANLTVVTPHGPDPQWEDSAVITVTGQAGVTLTKHHDDEGTAVAAGNTVTFTLVASDAGPSDAVGPVDIVDTLPAGLTYVSSSGPWDCAATGQVVTCRLTGDDQRIAAGGQTDQLLLTTRIDSAVAAGVVTNGAEVTTGTAQTPSVDDTAQDPVLVGNTADLLLTKTHPSSEIAVAGTTFSWDVTVTNLGPSISRADAGHPITVTDTLPTGTTFVANGSGGAGFDCTDLPASQLVTCTRTTNLAVDDGIAPPGAATFPIVVAIAPSVSSALADVAVGNTATVAAGTTPEPTDSAANNTATDVVTVTTRADLSITKVHAPAATAVAGSQFPWTITVTNDGPSESYADPTHPITFVDSLPAGVSFAGSAGPGGTAADFGCAVDPADNTRVLCSATAPLAVGPHVVVLSGLVTPEALRPTGPTELTNTVSITTANTSDQGGPNTASDTVPLAAAADLSIDKTHVAGAAGVPGQPLSWTLAVSNLGPSVSRGTTDAPITVTDPLPAGVSLLSATGEGWTCAESAGLVTCTLGGPSAPLDLAVGNAPPITVTVQVAARTTGTLTNSATVHAGATADPVQGDNTSTDSAVPVGPLADLSIVKTHVGAARIGDPLEYRLAVVNHGPSIAHGVTVTDTLPAGLVPRSAVLAGWSCAVVAQVVSCTYDDPTGLLPLSGPGPVGTEQDITVVADVATVAYPRVVNTAVVGTGTDGTPDPSPADNTSTDPVVVPPLVDLRLTKTVIGSPAVGREAVYRFTVTNGGPTPLPGAATITDTLPAGVTAIAAAGIGAASRTVCSLGATVSCAVPGPLAVDGTAVVDLTVVFGSAAFPTVTNTASVTSDAVDSDPVDNTATVTGQVAPLSGLTLDKALQGGRRGADGLLRWGLTVRNTGPGPVGPTLTVIDPLPQSLAFVPAARADPGWSCRTVGQAVTCTFSGALAPGDATTVTIATTASAAAGRTVTNSATLIRPGSKAVVAVAAARYTVPVVPPPRPTAGPTGTAVPPTTSPTTARTTGSATGSATGAGTTTGVSPTTGPTGGGRSTGGSGPGPGAGSEPGSASGSPNVAGGLPNTGAPVGDELELALWLIVGGVALWLSARRSPARGRHRLTVPGRRGRRG